MKATAGKIGAYSATMPHAKQLAIAAAVGADGTVGGDTVVTGGA